MEVLLVDDEPLILKLLSMHLESLGWKTHTATSGNLALQLLESVKPDLIITDMTMPDGDGKMLLEGIKKKNLGQPVVFFVTGDNELSTDQAVKLGAAGSLEKPIDFDKLEKILEDTRNLKNKQAS